MSIDCKNIFAKFVFTFNLRRGFFCYYFPANLISCIAVLVCNHIFSVLLEQFLDNLSLVVCVRFLMICGEWFDELLIYVTLSFVFFIPPVFFSKLKVTSKKSSSVKFAAISILMLILLKNTYIFYRILSVYWY